MNKKDFNEKIEMLRFCINDSRGAVDVKELTYAIKGIKISSKALVAALNGKLNHHALTLVTEAEKLLDRSTCRIGEIHQRINTISAQKG